MVFTKSCGLVIIKTHLHWLVPVPPAWLNAVLELNPSVCVRWWKVLRITWSAPAVKPICLLINPACVSLALLPCSLLTGSCVVEAWRSAEIPNNSSVETCSPQFIGVLWNIYSRVDSSSAPPNALTVLLWPLSWCVSHVLTFPWFSVFFPVQKPLREPPLLLFSQHSQWPWVKYI